VGACSNNLDGVVNFEVVIFEEDFNSFFFGVIGKNGADLDFFKSGVISIIELFDFAPLGHFEVEARGEAGVIDLLEPGEPSFDFFLRERVFMIGIDGLSVAFSSFVDVNGISHASFDFKGVNASFD